MTAPREREAHPRVLLSEGLGEAEAAAGESEKGSGLEMDSRNYSVKERAFKNISLYTFIP